MELEKPIQELKDQLSEANQEKEKHFREKEELKKKILSIIRDVKKIKSDGDKSSINIKEIKQNRYNNIVKGLIEKIKHLNQQKKELLSKHNIKGDPSKIKEQMDALELKVETEALTLNQEKKVMRQIKDLKKQYDKMGEVTKVFSEHSKISNEIEENRKKAEEYHNQLKELTKGVDYTQFKEKANEIEELKGKQQKAFNQFVEYKAKVSLLSNKIRSKQEESEKKKEENQRKKEEVTNKRVEAAEKEAEEKLKTKKRLTTDDLIKLQK